MRKMLWVIVAAMLSGCAHQGGSSVLPSPLATKVWEGSVTSRGFSTSRQAMEKDINDAVKSKYLTDGYAKKFVADTISKELKNEGFAGAEITYPDQNSCDDKVGYLKNFLAAKVRNWPTAVNYQLWSNTATGTSVSPRINSDMQQTNNPNGFTARSATSMLWVWGQLPSKEEGHAYIDARASFQCSPDNSLSFKVSVPTYEIKNPTLWLNGQKIAELHVNWDYIERSLDGINTNIVTADRQRDYNSVVARIVEKINSAFSSRYVKQQKLESPTIDRLCKVSYKVLLSRIQRKLNSYQFSSERSRYEFSDSVKYPNDTTADLTTIIKAYPEENGKTVVSLSLIYTPVIDSFSGNEVFGAKEAQKYLKEQQDAIDRIIAKQK